MQNTSPDRLSLEDEALAKCEQDPISTPGLIQPFGCLIGLNSRCDQVIYSSANLDDFLGVRAADALGKAASDLFPAEFLHDLRNAMNRSTAMNQRVLVGDLKVKMGRLNACAHLRDDIVQVELCKDGAMTLNEGEALNQIRWLFDFNDQEDIPALVDKAVHLLRDFSGYDRVKCYRFRPDGSGEVVAEARTPMVESYLGMRFPRFDIPPQARLLYAKTPIRMISDVKAPPIEILSVGGAGPLDTSLAILRASMPVHLEYLQNMDVRSTLTLPIVVEGKLWGLFAFHHRSPRYLGGSAAMALEFAGQLLSMRVDAALRYKQSELQLQSASVCSTLFVYQGGSESERLAWNLGRKELKSLIHSSGVAFWHEDFYLADGLCPDEAIVRKLPELLDRVEEGISISDHLSLKLPDQDLGGAAGALLIDLQGTNSAGFVFFRGEAKTTITWAGSPEKIVKTDQKTPRLSPRGSFEAFVEEIENRSDGWENTDISAARSLRKAARRTLSQKENWSVLPETIQLIQELNHRVRNILALVQSIVRQSRPKNGDIDAYLSSLEARILSLANAHNALTLKTYQALDLNELIMLEAAPFPPEQVVLNGPPVGIEASASTLMILILHELFSNAAKYGALSSPTGRLEISWVVGDAGVVLNWKESGGPMVQPPKSNGLGHMIINTALSHEFGGKSTQSFDPEGVSVELMLPMAAVKLGRLEETVPRKTRKVAEIEPAGLGQILIVDDDFLIAQNNKSLLEKMGAKSCLLAGNNETALDMIDAETIDLAFLDINLRGAQSIPTAQRLRERGIPFLFLTGYDSGTITQNAFSNIPVVRKPISEADLKVAIARVKQLGQNQ